MTNKTPKEKIVNKSINNVICIKLEQNEHTKNWIYSYILVLGLAQENIKLTPENIEFVSNQLDLNDVVDIPIQIIGGSYLGETIKSIIYRLLYKDDVNNKEFFQYGVVLSSEKIVVNVHKCGGGSILHIENLEDFIQYNKGEWKDYWTDENVN